MKNILKKILETQELNWTSSNKNFTYRFYYAEDECIDVSINRITTDKLIMAESLMSIFEPYIEYRLGGAYIYYVMNIRGCEYFVKVTKEEDIYFQSLLQSAYKKYQLKMFECINSGIDKLIGQKKLNATQKFEKEQQDTINNDKE